MTYENAKRVPFYTRSAPFVFELKKSEKIVLVSLIKIKSICPEADHLHPHPPSLPEGGGLTLWDFFFSRLIFRIKMCLSLSTRLDWHFEGFLGSLVPNLMFFDLYDIIFKVI